MIPNRLLNRKGTNSHCDRN